MSTAVGTPQDRPGIAIGRVTQLHVIRSEWTKLWSLRSTRWSLLVAVIGMAGLGIVIAAVQMAHWNSMSPNDRQASCAKMQRLGLKQA